MIELAVGSVAVLGLVLYAAAICLAIWRGRQWLSTLEASAKAAAAESVQWRITLAGMPAEGPANAQVTGKWRALADSITHETQQLSERAEALERQTGEAFAQVMARLEAKEKEAAPMDSGQPLPEVITSLKAAADPVLERLVGISEDRFARFEGQRSGFAEAVSGLLPGWASNYEDSGPLSPAVTEFLNLVVSPEGIMGFGEPSWVPQPAVAMLAGVSQTPHQETLLKPSKPPRTSELIIQTRKNLPAPKQSTLLAPPPAVAQPGLGNHVLSLVDRPMAEGLLVFRAERDLGISRGAARQQIADLLANAKLKRDASFRLIPG